MSHSNSPFEIGEVSRQLASGVAPARLTELISMAKKVSAKARAAARKQRDKWKTKRVRSKMLGGCQISLLDEPTGPDKRKHQSCGAPNLIHSIDASLLHLTFQRFDVPFSVIHDSVLCRATDMHTLSSMIRETYMSIFADQDYLREWGRQIGAETEPPMIDTLEAESVIESTYFFC